MRGDEAGGGPRRPVFLAGLTLLLLALAPGALEPSPAALAQALAARFPAIRSRLESPVRFEAASWRQGAREIHGLYPVVSPAVTDRDEPGATEPDRASAASAAVDHVRVGLPTLASDPVVAEGEGVRVVLAPRGARAARAEPEGATVAYRDVYAETDALHVAKPDWTEEYLHLRSPAAPRRFEYEIVEASGATRARLENGQVRFLDESGRGLVILSPVVVDAIGRRSATAARWTLDETQRRLTLALDPGGLEYPLLVDPTWITTGSLSTAREDGLGILLQNGTVLVMAGAPSNQDTSELYDPATGVWSPAGNVGLGRAFDAAVVLRDGRVLLIGGALTGGVSSTDCRFFDPATSSWSPAPSLNVARRAHTATLLNDGRVLVAGGMDSASNPIITAEVFDPGSNAWTLVADMTAAHRSHGAALLANGSVLVAAGVTTGSIVTRISEVFDPVAGTWTRVGDLGTVRSTHSLTVLPSGKVLAAGGLFVSSAEIFDPGTGLWTPTASLPANRAQHSATLLPSGRVIVVGGESGNPAGTQVYDPGSGTWLPGPSLTIGRIRHAATMLPDARLLVAGGFNAVDLTSAELLDVDTPTWTAGPDANVARDEVTLTPLRDGKVLAVGGVNRDTAEYYDGTSWTSTPNLSQRRWRHTATLLADGRVLVAGTVDSIAAGSTAELYDPAPSNTWSTTASMSIDRYWHTATLLPCGEVLVVGGQTVGSTILASAERYNPKTGTWRPTGALNTGRWKHTATLLADGKVLVTGGWNGGRLASAELYDPVAETWAATAGPMTVGRYHHTATLLPNGRVLIAGGLATPSVELFNPAAGGSFAATGAPAAPLDSGVSATLLPNGRVLAVGGFGSPGASSIYDPVTGAWTAGPAVAPTRDDHGAALLLDGRVLIAGGAGGGTGRQTALYDVGRGESPAWRPAIVSASDPLVAGTPLNVTGTSFQGLGEGSTGLGYMHSATNYPLVQLRRLDNAQVRFLPVEPTVGWSGTSFRSRPLGGFPSGPALVTVFTNGIPSVSRSVVVECAPPQVTTPPADAGVCLGGTAVLSAVTTAAPDDCPRYQWRKGGVAIADGGPYSGTKTPTLTVAGATGTEAGSYDVQASLTCSSTVATSAPATLTVSPAIGVVTASIAGPSSVCTTCLGGTLSETHAGGGAVTHQWGYRIVSGGAITDIPFATSPSYVLNGTDLPGLGNYFMVVKLTAACGGLVISDEVPVTVANTPGPTDEVSFFTVTSRDSQNVLEWVYPAGYNAVRIHATTGTPCVYQTDPLAVPTQVSNESGTAGAPDKYVHNTAANGTTYCYTIFVDTGGGSWSTGENNSGKPFATGGPLKWAFHSGMFSTTAPTVGALGIVTTNNDNAVHGMTRGVAGGEWPVGWKPVKLGGAVQQRSPIVPIAVGASSSVVFLGAQDGNVHAVDAAVGANAANPWPGPAPAGGLVQAAPAGLFTDFGGAFSYLLVGTRVAGTDNVFKAFDPTNGNLLGTFDNGGGPGNGIGIISSMAAVDYAASRVYFTSRARAGGSANTLWCLQLGPTPLVFTLAWARSDLGDIESSPVLRGGRVYVGSTNGGGTLYSIDAANGLAVNDRTFVHGDGPVRGFVFPDRNSPTGDLYFAADTRVWGVTEIGAVLANKYPAGITLAVGAVPNTLLFHPGSHYVYVGGSDGWLYQIDTLQSPASADYAVPLGMSPLTLGAPSLDIGHSMLHIGSEAGTFFAIEVPVLGLLCTSSCAGKAVGTPCSSFGASPCVDTCTSIVAGSCSDGGGA